MSLETRGRRRVSDCCLEPMIQATPGMRPRRRQSMMAVVVIATAPAAEIMTHG